MQLINANDIYSKMRKSLGSKRNEFSKEQIAKIMALYNAYEDADEKLSKVYCNEEFGYLKVKVQRPLVDENGVVQTNKKGKTLPDKSLTDTENIPLTEDVQEYMEREVFPYAPGAWIEWVKDKKSKEKVQGIVGYEIPFTRYFYEYTPLRSSSEILAELEQVEASIAEKLQKARG